MKSTTLHAAWLAGWLATASFSAAADTPYQPALKEPQLIAVLVSDAAPQDKAITCKQLAICGTRAAVPALAALLADEKLTSWARIALEAIPDPAATTALRAALDQLRGKPRLGVIHSLGVRRDGNAVPWLTTKLRDPDAELATACAAALGRIGDPPAVLSLQQALASAPPATQAALCEATLRCANRLLDQGQPDQAATIFEQVRALPVPRHILMEATRGLIVARQDAGIPLLIEQLRSPDDAMVAVALGLAHDQPGPALTAALLDALATLPAQKQVAVIGALASRRGPTVVPALLALTSNPADGVAAAAIVALTRVGDVTALPRLHAIALANDPVLAKAAQTAIYAFPAVDAAAEDLTARARDALKAATTKAPAPAANAAPAAVSLFNGKDLTGWEGNPSLWSVSDGCITGRTTLENPVKANTFLIWKGAVTDFVLTCKVKFTFTPPANFGNSGIQFRSVVKDPATWAVAGLQADMASAPHIFGTLYDEQGVGRCAQLGQKLVFKDGTPKVKVEPTGSIGTKEQILAVIQPGAWSDFELRANGPQIQIRVNGVQTLDVTNQSSVGPNGTTLALQLHKGAPMQIQFKDLMLQELK